MTNEYCIIQWYHIFTSPIPNLGTFGLFLMFNIINSTGKNILSHETLCLSLMFSGIFGKLIKTLAQFYVRLKRLSLLPTPRTLSEY